MYRHIRECFFLLHISQKSAPLLEEECYDNVSQAFYINYCTILSQAAKFLFYNKTTSSNGATWRFNGIHAKPILYQLYHMGDNSSIDILDQPRWIEH